MRVSIKGKMFLAGLEGICRTKYLDSVGVWTIAIGATKTEIPDLASWSKNRTLSIPACFLLLEESLKKYEDAVNKTLKVEVTQEQFDALVSICYNIGAGGLARSTFMKRINARASTESVVSAIMMWNKPKEIIGRRTKEAKLFSEGVYAGNGKALVFPVSDNYHPLYSKGTLINLSDYLEEKPVPAPEPTPTPAPQPNTQPNVEESFWVKIIKAIVDWFLRH